MRAVFLSTVVLLIGCTAPELQRREPKFIMPPRTNDTNAVQFTSASSPTVRDSNFGSRASPFHEYDQKIIRTIEKRWLDLTPLIQMRGRGQVVVDFKLNFEGGVSDLQVRPTRLLGFAVEICQRAILESAPFDPWPADMRRMIGERDREVTFTFNYR